MLISCKVSNSILSLLEKQGRDLTPVLQHIDVPEEFLRDPAGWVEAPKMENLLREIDQAFLDLPDEYMRDVGRNNEQLRAWGVLDSVLKMVESPLDIFCQPSRFISYFISPEPPIAGWKQDGDTITFQLPVSAQQYPYITRYLSGAFEGLPHYMRQPSALVEWDDISLRIQWAQTQENLLSPEDLHLRQFNPQWVRSVMDSLEQHQKNIENQQARVDSGGATLEEYRELQKFLLDSHNKFQTLLQDIQATKNDFLKLHDYFARSQQLVTFLVHSGRRTKQVDEAMRRMDWNHVQESYDHMVTEACERILGAKETASGLVRDFKTFTDEKFSIAEEKPATPPKPQEDFQLH